MARLVVIYRTPRDRATFDRHYAETHVPLARGLPGLRKYELSRGPVAAPAGDSGVHMVATLHFDDLAAIQAALASPEGRAAAADVGVFATGGAELLMFEDRVV